MNSPSTVGNVIGSFIAIIDKRLKLPHHSVPHGGGILPPNADASNKPNTHPHISSVVK